MLYIILSLAFWIAVEYITVWHSRFAEWISLMPWALIQYLGIVLIFYYFLFKRGWSGKKAFILMLVVMYFFELIWQLASQTRFLLLNPVMFIPGSILLISIWGFLTFIPLWIVKKSIQKHKKAAIFYFLWPALGFIISFLI